MPVYASQQDLETRFGAVELAQLTDRASGVTIDAAVVARALDDADGEIDKHIGVVYTLPLPSVPGVLRRIACDLARYWLYDDNAPSEVRRRFDDAIANLRRIAEGKAVLGFASATDDAVASAPAASARVSSPAQVFTDALLARMPGE